MQALYTILEYFDAGGVENIKVRIENAGGRILHVAVIVDLHFYEAERSHMPLHVDDIRISPQTPNVFPEIN